MLASSRVDGTTHIAADRIGSPAMDLQPYVDAIFARPTDEGISMAMIVLRDGEVVAERYGTQPETLFGSAVEIGPDSTLLSWSMAKSITHAAVGLLVADGRLDLDAPAPVPEWRGTPKQAITLLDLLEMRPGLRFVEDYVDGEVSHCIAMLFGEGAADMAAYAATLPLDHPPGTVWNYSSGTTNIIARILGEVVGGGRAGIETFLRERLFEPAGMTSAIPKFDDAGTWVGSSYVYATARDFARFGELYRNDGIAGSGGRVLPAGWADHGRTFVAHDAEAAGRFGFDYGRHWWMWPEFPGSIAAHGYEGQYTVVVPDRAVTVVHLGKTPTDQQPALVAAIGELIEAVTPT
jgi:CubicO group peptidase (beta-lactamase class C family)